MATSLCVLALSFLLLDLAVYVALDRHLRANLEEALQERVAVVTELSTELEPEELAERLTRLGIRATITLPAGRELRAEPAAPRSKRGLPPPPRGLEGDLLTREVPGEGDVVITVGVLRSGVTATMRQLVLIGAVATVLALCVAWGLLGRTTTIALRPIHALASTARRISTGQHDERLQPDRPDTDLGAMALSFDRMVDELAAALRAAHER